MLPYTPEQRVSNSIALLDSYGPRNWRSQIDWERLSMGSPYDCILGQLHGDYLTGLEQYDLCKWDANSVLAIVRTFAVAPMSELALPTDLSGSKATAWLWQELAQPAAPSALPPVPALV